MRVILRDANSSYVCVRVCACVSACACLALRTIVRACTHAPVCACVRACMRGDCLHSHRPRFLLQVRSQQLYARRGPVRHHIPIRSHLTGCPPGAVPHAPATVSHTEVVLSAPLESLPESLYSQAHSPVLAEIGTGPAILRSAPHRIRPTRWVGQRVDSTHVVHSRRRSGGCLPSPVVWSTLHDARCTMHDARCVAHCTLHLT